jgi:hypothetical protein
MMHSCASAAKLRGGGPILFPGMKAKGGDRNLPTASARRFKRERVPMTVRGGGVPIVRQLWGSAPAPLRAALQHSSCLTLRLRFNLPQPGVSIIRAAPQFRHRTDADAFLHRT